MKLIAWRNTVNNPCDDPRVTISIAPPEKGHDVFPWILPLAKAVEIFGKDDVEKIGTDPVQVFLTMTAANQEEP